MASKKGFTELRRYGAITRFEERNFDGCPFQTRPEPISSAAELDRPGLLVLGTALCAVIGFTLFERVEAVFERCWKLLR